MFEAICIRPLQNAGTPIDLGFLAEAMLFYRDVHVVADHETFKYLTRVCGPDSLFAAMEQGFLKLSYLENQLAVSTVDQGRPTERYGLHFVSSPKLEFRPFAEKQFLELTGKMGRSRRLASRFARHVTAVRWAQTEAQAAKEDLLDREITDRAAKALLEEIAPGFVVPHDGLFRVTEIPDALHVETNLDLAEAERCYKRLSPERGFGISTIVVGIFEALADLRFSAGFCSELAVSSATSAIAAIKLGQLLKPRRNSADQLVLFQEWTFNEGRAISKAVNDGHRNFDDILRLVESAQKFKEWLGTQPEVADTRREYVQQISRIDWADRLPPKGLRWLLFNAIGAALSFTTSTATGALTGAALSAIDAFMVDKLVKGWKPNQFVEGPLRAFVDAEPMRERR